jgi:hypothetical protein
MSGDRTKREMETGDKPTMSHGSTSSEESRTKIIFLSPQREEEKILFPQAASEWGQEKEDEKGGLLRDRYFINIDLRLRRTVRNF